MPCAIGRSAEGRTEKWVAFDRFLLRRAKFVEALGVRGGNEDKQQAGRLGVEGLRVDVVFHNRAVSEQFFEVFR